LVTGITLMQVLPKGSKYYGTLDGLSWNYLAALRLWFLEPPDSKHWQNIYEDKIISIENERKVYHYFSNYIRDILQNKKTTLQEDYMVLQQPLAFKRRCSVEFRLGEKEILHCLLHVALKELKALEKVKGKM